MHTGHLPSWRFGNLSMIEKKIEKQFDAEVNLGFKNLITSGCSFTYNNHAQVPVSWPFYLRDIGGFERVENLAMRGAGNAHISNATQWCLETSDYDPKDTLVIIMWSGADRDDLIIDASHLLRHDWNFSFTDDVATAISGGSRPEAHGNITHDQLWPYLRTIKSKQSRAIENYLVINNLYHYLISRRFTFLFLEFLDNNLPSRTRHFNIDPYLPKALQNKLHQMINREIKNFYRWSVEQDLLDSDMFHPNVNAHLRWTREILVPFLQKTISNC